jgi:hypothetical protein
MQLHISIWTHHLNHLLYSYHFYSIEFNKKFEIVFDKNVRHNGAILYVNNMSIFFDYSDDIVFLDDHEKYDCYFKRSLSSVTSFKNVYPLNFNVPLSYRTFSFLLKLKKNFLFYKHNKTELYRALDFFHLKSNAAHSLLDIRGFDKDISVGNGEALYYTRLWNPHSTNDPLEKARRLIQNEFRINACRIIKKSFRNSDVGLYPDHFSIKKAPDLVLDLKSCRKSSYLKKLKKFSIGIADDGLKDTPGWKIGEYLLHGKAVISTPISVQIEDFKQGVNYLELSSRSAYKELPDCINDLQKNNKYIEMGQANLEWSSQYIHPKNYLSRVLEIVHSHSNLNE